MKWLAIFVPRSHKVSWVPVRNVFVAVRHINNQVRGVKKLKRGKEGGKRGKRAKGENATAELNLLPNT